jgi:hypothetical protein
MELREVPRSIPTWRTSFFSDLGRLRLAFDSVRIGADAGRERRRDVLPVGGLGEELGLFLVRQAGDFGEDRRHLGGEEDDERGGLDPPVVELRIDLAQRFEQRGLHRLRQLVRLLVPHVGVDAVEQLAHVGQGVAGIAVLFRREAGEERVFGGAQEVGLDAARLAVLDPVDVDGDEDVGAPLLGNGAAALQGDLDVLVARHDDLEVVGDEQLAQAVGDVEGDVFLHQAEGVGLADAGAEARAAVAGVDGDLAHGQGEDGGGDGLRRPRELERGLGGGGGLGDLGGVENSALDRMGRRGRAREGGDQARGAEQRHRQERQGEDAPGEAEAGTAALSPGRQPLDQLHVLPHQLTEHLALQAVYIRHPFAQPSDWDTDSTPSKGESAAAARPGRCR